MSDIAFFAIPAAIALIGGLFGGLAVHGRALKPFFVALALVSGLSGGLYLAAESASGWDGVPYLIGLLMGSLPAVAGLVIGGLVGLVTRPRITLPS